jgi:glycosyltransferase involved in cell wall biosynthesis
MTIRKVVHVAKIIRVAGMERHLLTLLPALQSRGLDIHMIVLVNPNNPMDDYVRDMQRLGVSVEQMVIRRHLDPLLIRGLSRKFREFKADAVHTHLIHADLHGVLAAKLAGMGHIYFSSHNDDKFRRLLPVQLLQGSLWRLVNGGIAISDSLRQFLIRTEFAPPSKVTTVHYGLDPTSIHFDPDARQKLWAELNIPPDAMLLGSLCRLTAQKGLTYAIEALRQISTDFPNTHYVIAGEGELLVELSQQAEQAGLKNRVHFLGWRPDARDLLSAFDVFLIPSLWEGFGLVALEAMAASVPILASRVSALPEIVVDGETGYLVSPSDPLALAEKLRLLLSDRPSARQLGKAGRHRLEQVFSVDRMVDAILAVYRKS